MKTPEEKIILMTPKLLKIIKKSLPQIRNKYIAKELMYAATEIATELRQTKQPIKKETK